MVVPVMSYKVLAFGLTDIGLVRQNNEDAWGAVPEQGFFALADGMGGHQAGEIAARETIAILCKLVKKSKTRKKKATLSDAQHTLEHAITQANDHVFKMGLANRDLRGMGTTICCLQFHEEGVVYAHIGDSRIYRYHEKKLSQITVDHSLMRELIDLGQLSEGQAPDFMYKNIITKAIGTEPSIEPSIHICDIADEDSFLMCSDGLSDLLSLAEMEDIMNQELSVSQTAKALVNAAKDKGGYDNITVVLIRLKELDEEQDIS